MRNHRLIRLFVNDSLHVGKAVILGKEQSKYITSVMRLKVSTPLKIFDGESGEYKAKISRISKNECEIEVTKKLKEFTPCPNLTLFFSPVKNAKPEFIVQKATELGVSKIQPIITENTVKSGVNIERLKIVAIEAAEQCERQDIPEICEVKKLSDIMIELNDYKLMFCDESGKGQPISELKKTEGHGLEQKHGIIIGPEGGFSEGEIKNIYALKNSFGVGLGARILRADTAIITAISLWQNYFGDFNKSPSFREG